MKKIIQVLPVALRMEKDDPKNVTGMQMEVWIFNNHTSVIVRLYKHDTDAPNKLWDGKRTNGAVDTMVIELLKELGIVKNPENWNYSIDQYESFQKHNDCHKSEPYIYFSWVVKPHLINF